MLQNLLITFCVAGVFGFLMQKIKLPGGMLAGAMIAAAVLNVTTDYAYMPSFARMAAQITAGAFVAYKIGRDDVKHFKEVFKPAAIVVGSLAVFALVVGVAFYWITPLDLTTALFCTVPGGISDLSLAALDMGGNGAMVAAVQFWRQMLGITLFPFIIDRLTERYEHTPETEPPAQDKASSAGNGAEKRSRLPDFLITVAVATVFGLLGKLSGIPAGVMLFSMLGVMGFRLLISDRVYLPLPARRFAQVFSGAYIGCLMTREDVLTLKTMIVPLILLILAYMLFCFIIGTVLHKVCHYPAKEAYLIATPAGATEMALIALDLGVTSYRLAIIQMIRFIMCVAVFPQIINLIIHLV